MFTLETTGDSKRLFPVNNDSEQGDQLGKELYKKHYQDPLFKQKFIYEKFYAQNQTNEFVTFMEKPPQTDDLPEKVVCMKFLIKKEIERVIELKQETYKTAQAEGFISKCKALCGNKFIYVQQILPHKLNK